MVKRSNKKILERVLELDLVFGKKKLLDAYVLSK